MVTVDYTARYPLLFISIDSICVGFQIINIFKSTSGFSLIPYKYSKKFTV